LVYRNIHYHRPRYHHCCCGIFAALLPQVRAFKEDPLIFHGDLRVATGNELLRVREA
jgi:hypothetical protein